jgi:sugar phosphate isomerase/epimerase
MDRRHFLITSAAVVTASRTAWTQGAGKPDRVALMVYSFQSVLKAPGRPSSPTRTLDIDDVGQMFADRYKVHNVEMQHAYFESTEESYLREFAARLARTKSRVSNINLELGTMSISADNPVQRAQAVDLTRAWIDHAVVLGSPRVMINQGKLTPENRQVAVDTLKQMVAYGKTKNVKVGAEPRNDNFTLLTDVVTSAGAYTNPDIGNFGGDQANQHAGIRAMFPHNGGNCHIKALDPPAYDLAAAIRLIKELNYTGLYSIENEQQGDPYVNVQKVYDVLLATM